MRDLSQQILAGFAGGTSAPQLAPSMQPTSTAEMNPSALIEPLSAREIEVLRRMSEGLTNPQIAKELVISLSTVKTHLNNIYGKLNVRNRAEAVLHAKDRGIL